MKKTTEAENQEELDMRFLTDEVLTKFGAFENDNKIVLNHPDGYSEIYHCDKKNNKLSRKGNDGYSDIYIYDENGNLLSYFASNGYGEIHTITYDCDENAN